MLSAAELMDQLRWQDVVDVAILTFVLYRIYAWLRGTAGLHILFSMAAVVVAAYGASALGLMLTAYVLQALGAVAALVIVVVFRDEIRRGLRRVDPLRLFRRRAVREARGDGRFAVLADAAFGLAARRVGALVVIPRTDRVDDHLTGGTRLDSEPSRLLLEAIFHTGSPLHDGALLMDGGRIRLAGAFLPLTSSIDVAHELGTRHRAALGLSDVCDAAILVVSEERGEICIVEGGTIEPAPSTAMALAARLGELAGPPPAARRHGGRRRRSVDVFALVAIFLLVVGSWLLVLGGPGAVVIRTVEVELREVADELEVATLRPNQIRVHLRGPRTLLAELGDGGVAAWVDLDGVPAGTRHAIVTTEVPKGIDVVAVVPDRVTVRLRHEP